MGALGASIAALAGALVWAALAHYTGRESLVLTFSIGALIGGAIVLVGGRGIPMAVLAGVLAFASIVGGKWLTIEWDAKRYVLEFAGDIHEKRARDARNYAALPDPTDDVALEAFIQDHGFQESIEEFREEVAPGLVEYQANPLTAEELQNEFAATIDVLGHIKEGLGVMDVLYFLLGVGTAFGFVYRKTKQHEAELG